MRYIISILLIIIAGCSTNPPDAYENEFTSVNVFINSDIIGAEIFVDNASSGKITPDTIALSEGTHKISLYKDGYAARDTVLNVQGSTVITVFLCLRESSELKMVLVSDFANVSCDPCVSSNKILHSLESGTYKNKIAVVKYATYWPCSYDPFYLSAKEECDARISFYNVMTAPTVWIDGIKKPVPTDSNKVKEAIEERLSGAPRFGIRVTKNINGDYLQANVKVTFIDTSGLNFSDLVLHVVAVESEIEFSSPPGSNGETKFYHVVRDMLPTHAGEALINSETEYQRGITCNSAWNKSKINVVAFIQNKITKEVYQTGIN